MKSFMLLYQGHVTLTEEIGQAWGNWFASITDKTVGNSMSPLGAGREIAHSGTSELPLGPEAITGYSIIQAETIDEAVKIAQDCPIITGVKVYELMAQH